MKTKTNLQNIQKYIYPLATRIKENLTNSDIQLIISVLTESEKQLLKKRLLEMKIETKTPDDFEINRKIYKTVAIILDTTLIYKNK